MTPEEKIDLFILLTVRVLAFCGSLISLVILADFLLPGKEVSEAVEWKEAELSSSHRSRHYAYRVNTAARYFYCEKDFFVQLNESDTLSLNLSPVFTAVNSYACNRFMPEPQTFTLRYISGLLLPLLMWVITFLTFRIRHQVLYFMAFVLSILNLIVLIMLI